MKRPTTAITRRPRRASAAVARTPKQAAIQLTRIEFDISRLEMGIQQASQRIALYQEEFEDKQRQKARLLAILKD